jgi:hypothetical protein
VLEVDAGFTHAGILSQEVRRRCAATARLACHP